MVIFASITMYSILILVLYEAVILDLINSMATTSTYTKFGDDMI